MNCSWVTVIRNSMVLKSFHIKFYYSRVLDKYYDFVVIVPTVLFQCDSVQFLFLIEFFLLLSSSCLSCTMFSVIDNSSIGFHCLFFSYFGAIHLWRPQKNHVFDPPLLPVHMRRHGPDPPPPLVDVHTRLTWNTHRSLEMASTMTYRT